MKLFSEIALSLLFISLISCDDSASYKIINKTNKPVSISYDDRFYRSDLESKLPNIIDTTIFPQKEFFIGLGFLSHMEYDDIWPEYISVRIDNDTITLIGKQAILSVLNEKGQIIIK